MKNIPIFVINLEKAKERKAFIQQQFEAFPNVTYQFFNAINGRENIDYPLFSKYNAKKRFKRKGNAMNFAQLGCWASHYHLWEMVVERNQSIIVLEDDAVIHPFFQDAYQSICSSENQFEFLWLSPPALRLRHQKGKTVFKFERAFFEIKRFYKSWGNTTGYFITPQAAKKLLDYSKEWIYEVDITMGRYWENKIEYLAMTPFCVEPDFTKESSIPVDKGTSNRTLVIKIRRELYHFKDRLSAIVYNFCK